jgi:uncharacterized iron-regulated membrane protein
MKESFTRSMAWLHTWIGLLFGWVLFGVLLTGTLAVFYSAITLWAMPEIRTDTHPDRARTLAIARDYLEHNAAGAQQWRIVIPTPREPALRLVWTQPDGRSTTRQLDPETGALIARQTDGGLFFLAYHATLGINRHINPTGHLIVGAAGLAMLVACISGIVIHKRIFRDFFVFRPRAARQRAWMDTHNMLSVLPLPFHMMMAYTGLVLLYYAYIPAGVTMLYAGDTDAYLRAASQAEYREPQTAPGNFRPTVSLSPLVDRAEKAWGGGPAVNIYVSHPNHADAAVEIWRWRDDRISNYPDRIAFDGTTGSMVRPLLRRSAGRQTQSILAGVHFIEWGGNTARWLYFLCGLMSCAMVAAALILFVAKRERKPVAHPAFFRMVRSLNVAAIAGNMVACIAFFWAERLISPEIAGRKALVETYFFAAWLVCLVHAGLRPDRRAWIEQLALAGLLCLGLPLLGGHVGRSLPHLLATGDWTRAAVELTAMVIGAVLLAISVRLALIERLSAQDAR